MGTPIDRESAASTVVELGPTGESTSDLTPRRWFGRGRNDTRVPDWAPEVMSQALSSGQRVEPKADKTANGLVDADVPESAGRAEPPEPPETPDPSEPTPTPDAAPREVPMADLRLNVERSDSPLGQQTLQWEDTDGEGGPFGVRESALDTLGRLRIRMNDVVYLVPVSPDHGLRTVSITPIGLHVLVSDLDSGELLHEFQYGAAGSA